MAGADRQLARQLWLAYFNQTLFEQKLLTEEQRDRMAYQIRCQQGQKRMEDRR